MSVEGVDLNKLYRVYVAKCIIAGVVPKTPYELFREQFRANAMKGRYLWSGHDEKVNT